MRGGRKGTTNIDALRGAGIFKTTDAGSTWSILDADNDLGLRYVNDIVVALSTATEVYAATSTAVMRSLDGGTDADLYSREQFSGLLRLAIRTDTDYPIFFSHLRKPYTPGNYWRNPTPAARQLVTGSH